MEGREEGKRREGKERRKGKAQLGVSKHTVLKCHAIWQWNGHTPGLYCNTIDPFGLEIVRVPPQQVLRVNDGLAVPLAVAFVQDPVFVAVEMHWLWRVLVSSCNYCCCMERRKVIEKKENEKEKQRITYVRASIIIPHINTDRGISPKIDNALLRIIRIGVVFVVGFEEDGIIIAVMEAIAVYVKELMSSRVDELIHDEIIGHCGWGRGLRIIRHR